MYDWSHDFAATPDNDKKITLKIFGYRAVPKHADIQ